MHFFFLHILGFFHHQASPKSSSLETLLESWDGFSFGWVSEAGGKTSQVEGGQLGKPACPFSCLFLGIFIGNLGNP